MSKSRCIMCEKKTKGFGVYCTSCARRGTVDKDLKEVLKSLKATFICADKGDAYI